MKILQWLVVTSLFVPSPFDDSRAPERGILNEFATNYTGDLLTPRRGVPRADQCPAFLSPVEIRRLCRGTPVISGGSRVVIFCRLLRSEKPFKVSFSLFGVCL